jgi:hypothetical protein
LLGQLHQRPQAGGIDEVDPAEVDHEGQGAFPDVGRDEVAELLVGVGVELTCEAEQEAVLPPIQAAAQGDGESLQIGDRSSPRNSNRVEV